MGLDLIVPIDDRFTVFTGLKYQYFGTTSIGAAGKTASLNLDSALSAKIGIGWEF